MKELQKQIFDETEKLVGKFSFIRAIVYTVISAGIILLILLALSYPIDVYSISFAVGISFIYSVTRDIFLTKYSKKTMYAFYDFLLKKKPDITLYIPLFEKTRQGVMLKKASLYIDNNEVYMEAFNQHRKRNTPPESISIKRGRDFALDAFNHDESDKIITYQARLMQKELRFSLVNIKEVINLIESRRVE